jgi:ectoine hydroxylase-related dioxygenase (phytanoyl-CoA dioxygenase family)
MHCDGPTLSRHTYSINFWVPFADCPGDAPGLQLVPGPFRPMQEAVKHDLAAATVDHGVELEMQKHYSSGADGRPRFVPQLERGDVVVFHNWIMHASYATAEMTKPRTSFELRFNAPTPDLFEAFAG